jgi:hypothetical protein
MIQFDRRAWLRSVSLATGGLGASRLLGSPSSSPSPAGATLPAAARGSGVQLARLSLNENPYGPSPAVVAAIQREFSNLCRYTGAEYDALVGLIAAREGVRQGMRATSPESHGRWLRNGRSGSGCFAT